MSPEQNKKEKYGKEIDIYALGIIYFEMNHYFGSDMERCEVYIYSEHTNFHCFVFIWLAVKTIQVIGKLRTSVKVSIAFENELPHEVSV